MKPKPLPIPDAAAFAALPYRPCVGIMLLNREGLVFVGRRRRSAGPEHVDSAHSWQMPQGGIDDGEDPERAAFRELYEETSVRSAERVAVAPGWLSYDLPPDVAGQAWKGRYRGQTQLWFALRFTGDEREIDILTPAGGAHRPEFADWRWVPIEDLAALVIPFKRPVYAAVVELFRPYAVPDAATRPGLTDGPARP